MTPCRVNESRIQRAVAACQSNAWPQAELLCAEILGENPEQVDALQILGNIRARSGDTHAAEPYFERARSVAPDNLFVLNSLGGIYAANGRPQEARAALEAALRIDSRFPWALHNLGSLLMELGERRTARRCFERALESNPNHVDAIAALADAVEQDNQVDEARANDIDRELHAPRMENAVSASSPATVARLTEFVKGTDPATWTRTEADGLPTPVFLVGFPRSGTTLLEQVLAAHSGVVALEEQENFADAFDSLLLAPDAFERWASLPPSELTVFRRGYWKRVQAGLGRPHDGRLLVDKLPLNLALLPLIHRLFPDARIILALRDPRDVIVSCYRNRFAMNPAMFQFLSLDSAAR